MKKTIFFFFVLLFSAMTFSAAYAETWNGKDPFVLEASHDAEPPNLTVVDLGLSLQTSAKWTITAEVTYDGEPSNTTWGSRLFHAVVDGAANACNFYMRPPVGYPGATTSNTGKLLLDNAAWTDVLDIDPLGTKFVFKIESDGSGKVNVTAFIDGYDEPFTKTYTSLGAISKVQAGCNAPVMVTIDIDRSILVDPTVNFGTTDPWFAENKPLTKQASISGAGLSGNYTFELAYGGDDLSWFEIKKAEGWDDYSGGKLDITFKQQENPEMRTYSATVTVTNDDLDEDTPPSVIKISVTLKKILPEFSTPENPVWYYIQFENGRGFVIEDKGVGELIKTNDFSLKGDIESQQWTLTGTPDDIIVRSKSGNAIAWDETRKRYITVEQIEDAVPLSLILGGNANFPTGLCLYRRDSDTPIEGMNMFEGAGLNREIAEYDRSDNGTQIRFFKGENVILPTLPNTEKYYYIQAIRGGGRVLQSNGADLALSFDMPQAEAEAQLWKLTALGTDTYSLQSKAGEKLSYVQNYQPTNANRFVGDATGTTTISLVPAFLANYDLALGVNFVDGGTTSYFNQTNLSDRSVYELTNYSIDAGGLFYFIEEDKMADELALYPTISNEKETWYHVVAQRVVNGTVGYLAATGENQPVVALPLNKTDEAQWWKIVGTPDNYRFINKAYGEMYYQKTAETDSLTYRTGAEKEEPLTFKLMRYMKTDAPANSFQFATKIPADQIEAADPKYTYLNKSTANSQKIAEYTGLSDTGNAFGFIKVENSGGNITSITSELATIYPNPATDYVVIDMPEGADKIVVFNTLGQRVKEAKVKGKTETITVSDLMSGIYFVRVEKATLAKTYKFIVKH